MIPSELDTDGKRYVHLKVDVMVNNGLTFYATARLRIPLDYKVPVGYYLNTEKMQEAVYSKYPTLRKRHDVRFCEATIVKPFKTFSK